MKVRRNKTILFLIICSMLIHLLLCNKLTANTNLKSSSNGKLNSSKISLKVREGDLTGKQTPNLPAAEKKEGVKDETGKPLLPNSNQNPVNTNQKPVNNNQNPVDTKQKQPENKQNPVGNNQNPADNNKKPVDNTQKPADNNKKPADNTQKLADNKPPLDTSPKSLRGKMINSAWQLIFGTTQKNSKECLLKDFDDIEIQKQKREKKGIDGISVGIGMLVKRPDRYSRRKYGFDQSAYFFDAIDPWLQKEVSKEFEELYKAVLKVTPTLPKEYKDPYAITTLLSLKIDEGKLSNTLADNNKEEYLKKLKEMIPSIDIDIYKDSISAPYLDAAATLFKWNTKGYSDPAKSWIERFDYNGDGRLCRKEFIAMFLKVNYHLFSGSLCTNCFNKLIETKLQPFFLYADCTNNGSIVVEEIWEAIKQLKTNDPANYNIFKCIIQKKFYRVVNVNDFVLKSNKSIEGALTQHEFYYGLLMGYWNRQVSENKIYFQENELNVINLKEGRWENKSIDKECRKYNNETS